MSLDIHVWLHHEPPPPDPVLAEILAKVSALQPQLAGLTTMGEHLMTVSEDLAAEVDQVETVEGSAAALLDRIFALLSEGATKEQVDAQITELRASRDALVAAVVRNTPAEAPVEPTP